MLLVETKHKLEQTSESQVEIEKIKAELRTNQLARFALEDERGPLASPDELARELINKKPDPENVSPQFQKMAMDLTRTRLKYLDDLDNDYEAYRNELTNHQTLLGNLIVKIRETREYIDQNALWIRSANPVSYSDVVKSQKAVGSLLDPAAWSKLVGTILVRTTRRPYETAFGGFILLGLFVVSRRLRTDNA